MDWTSLTQLRWEELSLTQPLWLWILASLPLLMLVQRFSLVDLSRVQQFFSFLIRGLIIACLALAMSGLSSRSYSQRMGVVVAVDVSPSVPDASLKRSQEYIDKLWKSRKGKDELRVISFASSSRLLKTKEGKPPVLKRHPKEQASNLQGAIRHAYGLFSSGVLKRMVVVSDGRETKGSVLEEASRAKSRGVRVYSRAIKGPYPAEVLIQNLILPETIRLRAPFMMVVEVFSTYAAKKIPLTVYKDGFVFAFKRVDLKKGLQKFRFRVQIDEAGLTTFQVYIKPKKDRFKGNNVYIKAIPILGEPRILYLEGNPSQSHYLTRALQKQKFRVDVRSSYGIPTSIRDLERYDMVVISDVPAYRMSRSQMRLFETYVRDLGGGLIMVGGENSFGPGGYFQTRMEKILPVRFETEKKKETPSLALVMIIDKSGSMSGNRISLAREAAKVTVRMLGANDKVGVVAFDSRPRKVVPLQSSSNKSQIISDVSRIPASGGTSIAPALEMAYRMLSGARAKIKHVILLSDGQDSRRGIYEIVQAMNGEGITVSSIAVGSGSDRSLLKSIAEMGGGRSYYTEDPYNIPKIFTKETSKVSRSSFVEEPFRPRVSRYTQAIKGINFSSAPYLLGYVSTKAKPRSQVVLSTEYGEPLLVSWRYGLGKVTAFTSDVKNRWSVQWLSWSGFGQFWSQVMRDAMRQGPSRLFRVKAKIVEGQGKIVVDAVGPTGQFMNYMDGKATILDPRLKRIKTTLRQTGPGFYEGTFPAVRHGSYLVKASFSRSGKPVGIGQASASYAYPAEWLSASPNLERLRSIAEAGGGKLDPSMKLLWHRTPKERLLTHQPLWPYLVLLALILFVFDLFLRRVRLFGRAAYISS